MERTVLPQRAQALDTIERYEKDAESHSFAGQDASATDLLELALQLRLRSLGPCHVSIRSATEAFNRASNQEASSALKYGHDLVVAEQRLRKALALLVEVNHGLPKAKLELCFNVTLNNLAALHQRLDRPEAALLCLQEAESLHQALPYADAAATQMSLCAQLSKLGRHEEAERSAVEALRLAEADVLALTTTSELGGAQAAASVMRDKVSTLAVACNNLAVQREYLGQKSECLTLYEKAVVLAEGYMDKDSPLLERLRDSHRKAVHVAEEQRQRAVQAQRSCHSSHASNGLAGNVQPPRRLPPILGENGRPFSATPRLTAERNLATAVRAHERASSASAAPSPSAVDRPQRSRERRQGGVTDVYGTCAPPRASDQEILSARSLSKELANLLRPDGSTPQATTQKKCGSSREIENVGNLEKDVRRVDECQSHARDISSKKVTSQSIGTQTAKEENATQSSQVVLKSRSARRTSSSDSRSSSRNEAKASMTKAEQRTSEMSEVALSTHTRKVLVELKDAIVQHQPLETREPVESDSLCCQKGKIVALENAEVERLEPSQSRISDSKFSFKDDTELNRAVMEQLSIAPAEVQMEQHHLETTQSRKCDSNCSSRGNAELKNVLTEQLSSTPAEVRKQLVETTGFDSIYTPKGKDLQTNSIQQDLKLHSQKLCGDTPCLGGPHFLANHEFVQEPESECPPESTTRVGSASSLPSDALRREAVIVTKPAESSVPPTPPVRRAPKDACVVAAPSLSLPSLGGGLKTRTSASSIGSLPPLAQPPRRSLESHSSMPVQSQFTTAPGSRSGSSSNLPGLPEAKKHKDAGSEKTDEVGRSEENRRAQKSVSSPESHEDESNDKEGMAVLLQSMLRGYLERQSFHRQMNSAVLLQRVFRGYSARQRSQACLRQMSSAASTLQRRWRHYQEGRRQRHAARRIQIVWRRHDKKRKTQKENQQMKAAAQIQKSWRLFVKVRMEKAQQLHLAETVAKRWIADLVVCAMPRNRSATKLQSAFRRSISRRSMQVIDDAPRTFAIGRKNAIVTAEAGIDIETVLAAKPFRTWVETISKERRVELSKVHFQSVDMFGKKLGFIKFIADAKVDGKTVPGIVFMRGGAVAVLVILCHAGKEYALLVRQPRVSVCSGSFVEIPAGMLDGDGNFAGVAAKEMKEETGIELTEDDLVDMTREAYQDKYPGVFPTCGGSDEFNRIFLYRKAVSAEDLASLNGKLTGVREEGEMIKLQIIPLEALWRSCADAKALVALCLYRKLHEAGRIPKLQDGKHTINSMDCEPEPFVEPPPEIQDLGSVEEVFKATLQVNESMAVVVEGENSDSALPWTCGSCGFYNEVSPSICVLCDGERSN